MEIIAAETARHLVEISRNGHVEDQLKAIDIAIKEDARSVAPKFKVKILEIELLPEVRTKLEELGYKLSSINIVGVVKPMITISYSNE